MPDPTSTDEESGSETKVEEQPKETSAEGDGAKPVEEAPEEGKTTEDKESHDAPSKSEDPVKKAIVSERSKGYHRQKYLTKIRNAVAEDPNKFIEWAQKDPKTVDEMLIDDAVMIKAYNDVWAKPEQPPQEQPKAPPVSPVEVAKIVREETARLNAIDREDQVLDTFRRDFKMSSELEEKVLAEMDYRPGMPNYEKEFKKAYLYVTENERLEKQRKEQALANATLSLANTPTPGITKTKPSVKIPQELMAVWKIAKRNDPTMTEAEFMRR